MWATALIYGIIGAGYSSVASHKLHLFLPVILLLMLPYVRPKLISSINLYWFAFTACIFLLFLTSATFGEHGGTRAWGFVVFAFGPLCALAYVPTQRLADFFQRYLTVAALAICAWIFFFYIFFAKGFGRWQLESAAGSGNLYGAHLNMIWPVLLGWAIYKSKNTWQAGALSVLSVACIVATLLSFSRLAFVMALGLSSIFLFIHQRRSFLLILLSVLPLLFYFYREEIFRLLELYRLVNFKADYPRTLIWEQAAEYVGGHWLFGASPGGAEFALSDLEMYHAHSNIVNAFLEMGVIAGLVVTVLTGYFLTLGIRCFWAGGMARYIGSGILSYVAASMVSTPIQNPELTLTLILLILAARKQLELEKLEKRNVA